MTDHPVLIPTSKGAVGGIVSEPEADARAALLLLSGYGRPARSGINSFWTRTARSLAAQGVVVLRIDYSREGETLPIGQGGSGLTWKRDLDLRLVEQVASWFRGRVGGTPLLLVGACSGARLAIELAGRDPAAVEGTFFITPYIKDLAEIERRLGGYAGGLQPGDPGALDPRVVECFRRILTHGPSWVLVGELDDPDLPQLQRHLGPTPHHLEVEVVPNHALHLLDQPQIQDEAGSRLLARIAAVVSRRDIGRQHTGIPI
jgi:dienelactone hydrolase